MIRFYIILFFTTIYSQTGFITKAGSSNLGLWGEYTHRIFDDEVESEKYGFDCYAKIYHLII